MSQQRQLSGSQYSQVGLFESSWSMKSESNAGKITSIDQNHKNVYVGYQSGNIEVYQIDANGFKLALLKSQQQAKNRRFFSRNSIDVLREFNGYLLVISEGFLICLDGESLESVDTIIEKVCIAIAINESISNRLLALTKKKEVLIYDFEHSPFGFRQFERKFNLLDVPLQIAFSGDKIIYTNPKKEYGYLEIVSNTESCTLKDLPKCQQTPIFKIMNEEEMFVLTSNNLGIFLTLEGYPKQKNTLQLEQSKNVLTIHIIEQSMIVFYEGTQIDIFNNTEKECTLIQQMDMSKMIEDKQVKYVTPFQNQSVLYFSTSAELRNFYPVPFDEQISKLLSKCEIGQAIRIFDQHYPRTHPNRQRLLEELNIDSSWALLMYAKFDDAYQIIEDNYRYDIRQYFDSFSNEEDIGVTIARIKKNLTAPKGDKTQSSKGISQAAQEVKGRESEFRMKILQFLIKLCLKNRDHYMKFVNVSSQVFDFFNSNQSSKLYTASTRERHGGKSMTMEEEHRKFMESQANQDRTNVVEYFTKKTVAPNIPENRQPKDGRESYGLSINDDNNGDDEDQSRSNTNKTLESNVTAKEMLEQIDFFMLKYLIMQDNSEKELIQVLSNTGTHCPNKYDELLQLLQAKTKGEKFNEVLSLFYEHFSNHTQALLLWQEIIHEQPNNVASVEIACENISRILCIVPRDKLINDFLPEVARSSFRNKVTKVFAVLNPSRFPPARIRLLVQEIPSLNQKDKDNLIGNYYEQIVMNFEYQDTNIHNSLADYYLKYLFSVIPKSTPSDQFKKSLKSSLEKNSSKNSSNLKSSSLLSSGSSTPSNKTASASQNVIQYSASGDFVINQETIEKYKAFDSFIRNPKMLYDAQFVLKMIVDSFLQEQIIYLLCNKLDRQEKALRILIDQGDDKAALAECSKDQAKLLPILFKIYLQKYNVALGKNPAGSNDNNMNSIFDDNANVRNSYNNNNNTSTIMGMFGNESSAVVASSSELKQKLDNILMQYSYCQDVNPIEILKLIPDDWVLEFHDNCTYSNRNDRGFSGGVEENKIKEEDNSALFEFLTQALSETLYTQRQMRCTSFSSETELLEENIKLIHLKRAYVTQYSDRKCAACNKLIINNTIFVVFPNGVVAHQSCVGKNLSICPETGQDFLKTMNF